MEKMLEKQLVHTKYTIRVGELAKRLSEAGISFEIVSGVYSSFMIVFPSLQARKGDIILHDYSYGRAGGLFEGAGAMSKNDDDVYVFDNDEEIIELAKERGF